MKGLWLKTVAPFVFAFPASVIPVHLSIADAAKNNAEFRLDAAKMRAALVGGVIADDADMAVCNLHTVFEQRLPSDIYFRVSIQTRVQREEQGILFGLAP